MTRITYSFSSFTGHFHFLFYSILCLTQVEWSHFHKQFHFIRRALQEVNYHLEERKALPEELRQEIHRDYEDWPGKIMFQFFYLKCQCQEWVHIEVFQEGICCHIFLICCRNRRYCGQKQCNCCELRPNFYLLRVAGCLNTIQQLRATLILGWFSVSGGNLVQSQLPKHRFYSIPFHSIPFYSILLSRSLHRILLRDPAVETDPDCYERHTKMLL